VKIQKVSFLFSNLTLLLQFIHSSLKIVMVKFKHSRIGPQTLIFTLLATFTFFVLILILLSFRVPKPNHLNSISHNAIRFLFNSITTHLSLSLSFSLSHYHMFYAEAKMVKEGIGLKSYRGSLEHFYIIIFWLGFCFLF
jgi:hypothetical protein